MRHKWDTKYHIYFWLLIIIGGGLCVGGIFVAPLLIPGGVCLAGAFGMFASSYVRMYPWHLDQATAEDANNVLNGTVPPAPPPSRESSPEPEHHEQTTFNIHIEDRHVDFHPHFDVIERPRRASLEPLVQQSSSAPQLTLS